MILKLSPTHYINLDNVAEIRPSISDPAALVVEFVGGECNHIKGDGRQALLSWLDRNSQDVHEQAPPPLSERIDRVIRESSGPVVADLPF